MFNIAALKPTLLVIDDTPENLTLIYQLLKEDYTVKGANNGKKGLALAKQDQPDLILLDIMMPDMDGYEVCEYLKRDEATKDIPVIFVTAKAEKVDEHRGLVLGAVDYITKPINPDILRARVKSHVALKITSDLLRGKNISLEKEIAKRTEEALDKAKELNAIQDIAFYAMVSLAETRDNETGSHIKRTQTYVKLLAQKLRENSAYSAELSDDVIELLYKSAPLHDIGKIGIADEILLKKGKLTEQEFESMKAHTTLGFQAIENAEKVSGSSCSFLRYAKEIAHFHHERWDGTGYPTGLQGEAIPLSARLMAVADVYDALISKRVYKPAFTHQDAVEIINEGNGTHFDPNIVAVFNEIAQDLYQVAQTYGH